MTVMDSATPDPSSSAPAGIATGTNLRTGAVPAGPLAVTSTAIRLV